MPLFVRNFWRTDILSVRPETTADEALVVLQDTGVTSLPVTRARELVGVITARAVYDWALSGRVPRVTVADLMDAAPEPVHPDDVIEEVAVRMLGEPLNFLPVVDETGELVAIVTRDALIAEFARLFGAGEENTRFTLAAVERPGQLERIARIVGEHGGNITHVVTHRAESAGAYLIMLRVDVESPGALAKAFAEAGFGVVDVFNFRNGRRIGLTRSPQE